MKSTNDIEISSTMWLDLQRRSFMLTKWPKTATIWKPCGLTIKQILNKRKTSGLFPTEFKVSDKPISDPRTIACKFNEFFTKTGPTLASQISKTVENQIKYMESSNSNTFTFTTVTEQEIRNIILSLKNTSPGHDKFDARLVKESADWIVKPLCHIFNLSCSKGYSPTGAENC